MTGRTARRALFTLAALAMCFSATEASVACSGSGIAWTCPAGTTVAEVNSVLKSATDGATVTFAAGAYDWTTGGPIYFDSNKGVTVACAAIRQCVVTRGVSHVFYMDSLSGDNTHLYRVSGFVFGTGGGFVVWWYSGNGTSPSWIHNCRIDHNTIDNIPLSSIAIFFGGGSVSSKFNCVVDNNIFSGVGNFMSVKYLGPGNPDLYSSSVRGTADNVFVEDNIFSFTNWTDPGSGCIDVWYAGSVVVRHNDSTNCVWTSHGVIHNTTVNFELYQNTLRRTAGSGVWTQGQRLFHHQGSGEITAWGNTFYHTGTLAGNAIEVTHYRSAAPSDSGYPEALGRCDGTSPRDGNRSPSGTYYGYPCWMQPGRAPAGGSPGYGKLSPMYFWMNIDATTGLGMRDSIWANADLWSGPPFVHTHIVEERDFYREVSGKPQTSPTSPFNGATGMGFGTVANRPTTCTTNPNESGGGVAYWATDVGEWDSSHPGPDGQLYRCSATNTWTLQYLPYPYPHPLRGSAPSATPAVPTGVRIIR